MLYVHIGCYVDVGAKAERLDDDGNNGCLSTAVYPDCLIRPDQFRVRRITPSLFILLRLGLGAYKWHHSHFTVCSVYLFPHHSARKNKQVVFQCNLFIFLRTIWYDTCSRLLVLGLCFIVLIFQIKLLSVIHTDPGFNADCLSNLCPVVCWDSRITRYLHFMHIV